MTIGQPFGRLSSPTDQAGIKTLWGHIKSAIMTTNRQPPRTPKCGLDKQPLRGKESDTAHRRNVTSLQDILGGSLRP